MTKNVSVFVVMLVATSLMAQRNKDTSSQPPTKSAQHVTVHGCVRRLSSYYLLSHTEVGNPFVLDSFDDIDLDKYVGRLVEVVGSDSHGLSSSKKSSFRLPLTLLVHSITSVPNSKPCTH